MAIDITQSLTKGVNWEWRETDVPLVEVDYGALAPSSVTTKTFTLRHDFDGSVVITGFYLAPIESMDDYEPFQERWEGQTPLGDIDKVLYWGNQFETGLYIVQGAVATRFTGTAGSSWNTRIPCTLGVDSLGKVDQATEITIGLRVAPPSSAELKTTQFLNFNVKIAYRKIV